MTRFVFEPKIGRAKSARDEYVADLESRGWEELGRGCFAVTLMHPKAPGEVLKVAVYDQGKRLTERMAASSEMPADGWLAYLRAFQGSRSKHLPVVSKVTLFGTFYVAATERLWAADEVVGEPGTLARTTSQRAWSLSSAPWLHPGSMGRFGVRLAQATRQGFDIDCHSDNIMFRADGTAVFTDPFVSYDYVTAYLQAA